MGLISATVSTFTHTQTLHTHTRIYLGHFGEHNKDLQSFPEGLHLPKHSSPNPDPNLDH